MNHGDHEVEDEEDSDIDPEELEEQQRWAEETLETYADEPICQEPLIAPVTDTSRNRNMERWIRFFTKVKKTDYDAIWQNLCYGEQEAMRLCRLFLENYVKYTTKTIVVLGPEETKKVRAVNSAATVTQCWRELIAKADGTVLEKKRNAEPSRRHFWQLAFKDHTNQRARGPVFEISRWIFQTLAPKYSLMTTLTFTKREATAEDIIIILSTLWKYAEDIPCDPATRLTFHMCVIVAAIIGARSGTIFEVKYDDVSLTVVRDPKDHSKKGLVVAPTIGKNKLQRKATRVSRALSLSFALTLIPYKLLCLASAVAARAIHDDAFEPSFASSEELLNRVSLDDDGVNAVPLHWKECMEGVPLWKISATTFYMLWERVCLVAGMRIHPRFYATRVGAGGRLDGVLSDAVRNFVLSHTTQVFQTSYQTHLVRENLAEKAFNEKAGSDGGLVSSMRNMTLNKDANAPIDPTVDNLAAFEKRKDMTGFRAEVKAAQQVNDTKKARSVNAKADHRIDTLSKLQVKESREKYFADVDKKRALGWSTKDAYGRTERKENSNPAIVEINQFLEDTADDLVQNNQYSEHFITLLVNYLAHRGRSSLGPVSKIRKSKAGPKFSDVNISKDAQLTVVLPLENGTSESTSKKKSRCLICSKWFRDRPELTKHCKNIHVKKSFKGPFSCPECLLQHIDIQIDGASAWSAHCEKIHGLDHTPRLLSCPPPASKKRQCLLCRGSFTVGRGFTTHLQTMHVNKGRCFEKDFECPECVRQGSNGVWISGLEAWKKHVDSVHPEADEPEVNEPEDPPVQSLHDTTGDFQVPVSCPESSVQANHDVWIEGGWSVWPHYLYTTTTDLGGFNGPSLDLPVNWPSYLAGYEQAPERKRKRDDMDVYGDFEATAPMTSGYEMAAAPIYTGFETTPAPIYTSFETAPAPIYTGFETAPAPAIYDWQVASIPSSESTADFNVDRRQLTRVSSNESLPTSDTGTDPMSSSILTPTSSMSDHDDLGGFDLQWLDETNKGLEQLDAQCQGWG